MLDDSEDYVNECVAADGERLRITSRGSVVITETVMRERTKVRLTDVHFAGSLERNIISHGLLGAQGCELSYRCHYRVVAALKMDKLCLA